VVATYNNMLQVLHALLFLAMMSASPLVGAQVSGGNSLYVFAPTTLLPHVVKTKIQTVCPSIKVTVFGNVSGFEQQISRKPPNAILTVGEVAKQITDFTLASQGLRNGKPDQPYLLVSLDQQLDQSDLSTRPLGVLEILGRKAMEEYVYQLLEVRLRIQRVRKLEDLLSLLRFRPQTALLITEDHYRKIKDKSNLNLVATPLDGVAAVVGVFTSSGQMSAVASTIRPCLDRFDDDLNRYLGVDEWDHVNKTVETK